MSGREIRFTRAPDGVRIAYVAEGRGPALVKAAHYLTHLDHDGDSPVWRPWIRELSRGRTLVRYDERGCGLSDRDVVDFSMPGWLGDLEAVVDAVDLERFALLGLSQGAAVALAYAARHPDRVSHLVVCGGYARGRLRRDPTEHDRVEAETMVNAIRVGWGRDNPAFRQLFTTLLMPDGTADQHRWLNRLARVSASPESAALMERAFYDIDVTSEARRVRAPTLVFHARDDATVPFEEGRILASLVPGARFVPLDGRNHVLAPGEPAWDRFVAESRAFLGPAATESRSDSDPFPDVTRRERDVLELVARGLDNEAIAARLGVSSKTVRNHVSSIYAKLGVDGRAPAIVRAREAGYGRGGD